MANVLYGHGKEGLGLAAFDLTADTFKLLLLTAGYVVNLATDKFLSDIPGGDVVATSAALAGKTLSAAGVWDANDVTFTALAGSAVTQMAIYKDTGVAGTSRLLAYFDTAGGMPFTPAGIDVTIIWSGSGILQV